MKQAQIDNGLRPGTTTVDAGRVRQLEKENAELRRANAILRTASAFFAAELDRPLTLMVAYIDAHRGRFGVEPICRVLRQEGYGIAPSTYYATRLRPPSARTVRDARLEGEIVRVFKASGERSGARKVWWDLHREHIPVGRCTVERLMRRLGLRGVRRGGYKVVTTVRDSSQDRPGDLVDRDFRALRAEPVVGGRLHLRRDLGRDRLHRAGHRRVLPDDRRVEDRRASPHDPGAGRPGHGGRRTAP